MFAIMLKFRFCIPSKVHIEHYNNVSEEMMAAESNCWIRNSITICGSIKIGGQAEV